MNATEIKNKTANIFKKMTVAELLEAFEATEKNNAKEIPTVRGWIMDELEARNPEAFYAWLEGDASIKPNFYF